MFQYWLHIFMVFFVLLGGINWGFHAFGYNLVYWLNRYLSEKVGKNYRIDRVIYIMITSFAIFLAIDRNTWLPFLGESVLPEAVVQVKPHNGDTSVTIQTEPGAKVAYWSAKPLVGGVGEDKDSDIKVKNAYGDYSNSGVVLANEKGDAVLKFDKGSSYVVPTGMRINSHVHYRVINGPNGLMGPVQTVNV